MNKLNLLSSQTEIPLNGNKISLAINSIFKNYIINLLIVLFLNREIIINNVVFFGDFFSAGEAWGGGHAKSKLFNL